MVSKTPSGQFKALNNCFVTIKFSSIVKFGRDKKMDGFSKSVDNMNGLILSMAAPF